MVIDDADKLNQVLQDNPEQIAAFGDESSPIAAILSQSESFTESGGLSSLEDSLEDKIDNLDRLIEREEDYLIDYEEQQRKIFNELMLCRKLANNNLTKLFQFSTVNISAPSFINYESIKTYHY